MKLGATINLFLIIIIDNQWLHATAVSSYPGVRLRGGSNVYEGQVEVLDCDSSSNQCTWKTVCTSNWNGNEASVTCRQLGLEFYSGNESTVSNSTINMDSDAVMITCDSSAYSALGYCSISNTSSCGSNRRASVQCSSTPQSPSFDPPSFNTTTPSISATIQWTITPDDRSTKYQIRCSNDGYCPHIRLVPNITLYNLEPCTLTTCCVGGIDINGAIGSVKCTSFKTPASHSIVSVAPTGLKQIGLQSQAITLQWEKLPVSDRCNPPVVYSVKVEGCNGQQQNESNTYIIIKDLCSDSLYNASVKACTNSTEIANACGPYSIVISAQTFKDDIINSKPVKITVSPILLAIIVTVTVVIPIILVILVLGIKKKKTHKNSSYCTELVKNEVNSDAVFENATAPDSEHCERRVKPPAVPPKTYLEPKTETEITDCLSLNEETQSRNNDDDETYSMGSDSSYDMKLEPANRQLPKQSTIICTKDKPVPVIQEDTTSIQNGAMGTDGPTESSESLCTSGIATVTDLEERIDMDEDECSNVNKSRGYQMLDAKTLSHPSYYDGLHLQSNKREDTIICETNKSSDASEHCQSDCNTSQ